MFLFQAPYLIYVEVLECENTLTCQVPNKILENTLRYTRSEEDLVMYYTGNTSPRDFSVYGSIGDFDDADCWSQEDDEIMQVIVRYLSWAVNAMSTSGFKPVSGVIFVLIWIYRVDEKLWILISWLQTFFKRGNRIFNKKLFKIIDEKKLNFTLIIFFFISSPKPKAPRWAISIPMTPSPVRPSINIFKHLLLWNHWANWTQFHIETP